MTKKIHDVMHSGVESHAPDATLSAIAKTMKERDIGAVPIVEKGQLVGMVTDRDITLRALADGKDAAKLTGQGRDDKECRVLPRGRFRARGVEDDAGAGHPQAAVPE